MKKNLLFFILFIVIKGFSQDFMPRATPKIKSEIIYKDGRTEKGFLWLANSAFSLRLKVEKKRKSKKIDYEIVDTIITNPDSKNQRKFQYLKHNYNRFKIFVELISTDEISIYIASKNNGTELFYSEYDRETTREKFSRMRFENTTFHNIKRKDTLELPNGKKMLIPTNYSYFYELNFESFSVGYQYFEYYILKKGDTKLIKVEKNKRFLKKSKENFKNCPSLIKDIEEDKINVENLPTFIEYYKEKCQAKKK